MRTDYPVWIGLFLGAVLVTLAAGYFPYFPGDVALTRWGQALLPQNLAWAETLSATAKYPWLLLILALVFVLSWILAGWRAALVSLLSLAGMLALGAWLGLVTARPRPSPELVQVYRPLRGYGFPSLFALRYAATFGFLAVLAVWKGSGPRRVVLLILSGGLLVLGGSARVALAAHWPSDVIISFYWGLLWAGFLIRLCPDTWWRPPNPH